MRSPEKASISFGGLVPFLRHFPQKGRHVSYVLDMIPAASSQRNDGQMGSAELFRDPAVHRFSATGWLPSGYVKIIQNIENGPFMVDLPIKTGDFP